MCNFLRAGVARLGVVVCVLLGGATASAARLRVESRGEIGSETRFFVRDDNEALTEDVNSALVGRVQLDAKLGQFKLRARGFARYDATDDGRNAVFPEDVYLEWKLNPLRVRVGAQMMNWTATEAFHPADIINSRYLDSSVENAEKRGELMASARVKFLDGNVEGYFMPFFVSPIFPSPNSRLSFGPPGVTLTDVRPLERGGKFLSDWELTYQMGGRVQQSIGDADVSAHVISHIDRSTPQVVAFDSNAPPVAVFQPVIQFGGTYQQVFGPYVAKLEAAYRRFYRPASGQTELGPIPDRPNFGVIAAGAERSLYHEDSTETTLIVEAQSVFAVDGIGFFDLPEQIDLTLPLFQRDVLIGARHARNDAAGQEVLVTGIVNVERPEQVILSAVYSRRIGETFGLKAGGRFIRVPPPDGATGPEVGFAALNNDHQIYLNLTRYF